MKSSVAEEVARTVYWRSCFSKKLPSIPLMLPTGHPMEVVDTDGGLEFGWSILTSLNEMQIKPAIRTVWRCDLKTMWLSRLLC